VTSSIDALRGSIQEEHLQVDTDVESGPRAGVAGPGALPADLLET
jgi:hypothetical protein